MIGQLPWVGQAYEKGVDGQKLLLLGLMHRGRYGDDPSDPAATRHFFTDRVLTGNAPTFRAISDAFGDDRRRFWQRVAFAQLSPEVWMDEDDRFAFYLKEDTLETRLFSLLDELRPDKLLVISQRAWALLPTDTGSIQYRKLTDLFRRPHLSVGAHDQVELGSFRRADGGETIAYRVGHGRFLDPSLMGERIRAIMAHRPEPSPSEPNLDAHCKTETDAWQRVNDGGLGFNHQPQDRSMTDAHEYAAEMEEWASTVAYENGRLRAVFDQSGS